nr:PREDICTED: protein SMAX1-LIKE 3-like [Musa acuminata subsp. malaccensis]
MRAGGCTVQQALTPEAATVVKQAINLARRRGHAQVTPLHVANTMLSSSTGLLRAACLQSHSHPLQCKALELCFNVALNRLPASTLSAPMLGLPQADHHHHLHPPSLSNALVAAFKRAQAHQRRGSIETQQQQPLLAVKIELEQLVISILDDPSVSRVMREAGFSSTQVKSNVEQAVSVEICSSTPPSCTPPPTGKTRTLVQVKNEDVMSVTDALVSRRKKSIVIVGECLATAEAVVGGVRDRVHKGEVPEVSRNLQFITLPLFSFRQMPAEEVDQKVGELRCFVKSCCVETGVVLYLKDLDWAAEYRASRGEKGRSYYCSLEHILMEIKNLAFGGTEGEHSNERIWLMAIATYQTYTRFCRTGSPSLETLLALQPLTIPAGGLGLSLNFDSGLSEIRSKIGGVQFLPPAADEIGSPEVPSLHINSCGSLCSMSSGLPSWLRRCKEEGNRDRNSGDQGCRQLKELCRQWNSICTSTHKSDNHPSEITFNFSSVSPSSSSNVSSYDGHSRSLHQNQQPSLLPRKAKRPWNEHHFWISEEAVDEGPEQKPGNKARENAGQKLSTFPFLYLNSHPNSNSSGSTMETELSSKFKELNAENFKFLCDALERKVTWQQDIIPEIASIILQCRSGLMRRKGKSKSSEKKEETWLLFQGSDTEGKERIGRELARLVFGSSTNFITVGHSNLSSTQSDSTDVLLQIKRSRAEASHSRLQSLFEAIREDPHRVIMMEDIEQVDHYTLAGIMRAMERGKLQSYGGEEVSLGDAIIILSCESFDSRSRACSPLIKQRAESEDDKEVDTCVSLDLNLCAADEDLDDHCFDSAGLLECVDRAFFFNLPDVL